MNRFVVLTVRRRGVPKLELVRVVRGEIRGGIAVVKMERVQVICPACGEQVEAVAGDGRVKGYCAVAKQCVNFLIETQPVRIGKDPTAETKTKLSAAMKKRWQDPEFRARMGAARKEKWQDPEYQAKQVAAQKGKHLTAETRAKISAALTKKGGESND